MVLCHPGVVAACGSGPREAVDCIEAIASAEYCMQNRRMAPSYIVAVDLNVLASVRWVTPVAV